MGWFLWGIAFGWGMCAIYYYNQNDANDRPTIEATIIAIGMLVIALIVSVNLGIASGTIPVEGAPTPTIGGR